MSDYVHICGVCETEFAGEQCPKESDEKHKAERLRKVEKWGWPAELEECVGSPFRLERRNGGPVN